MESPEAFADMEDLRRQLSINRSQILLLRTVARANALNYVLASLALLLLIVVCVFSFAAVLFPGVWLSRANPVLVQFAGPLCLLSAYGAVQVARFLLAVWVQNGELKMIVSEQKHAINFAESVLRDTDDDRP